MIHQFQRVRSLNLASGSSPGRPAFLSAASGLVGTTHHFYVVADDELSLGIFSRDSDAPGSLFRIFPGELPVEPASRKKAKPDLEALAFIDLESLHPTGCVLTIPSGSTDKRTRGALILLNEMGLPASSGSIEFSPLFKGLMPSIPELNIEGAIAIGDRFLLFQRGNGQSGQNLIIELDLKKLSEDLCTRQSLGAHLILGMQEFELGSLGGARLSFTDAALDSNNHIWFIAVAEATESTYADGDYRGAVIGKLDQQLRVAHVEELNCPTKPEGLWFSPDLNDSRFFITTDADDPDCPSELYQGRVDQLEMGS